jgi:hypothetical protein
MKRTILLGLVSVFGLGLLVSMTWVGVTHATDVRTGDKPTLASNETTDNSLYAAGDSVLVAGTVKGDLFCAGNNVDVTGIVEGDVICAGQAVRVTGTVLGDVRVAGSSVELSANVKGSVTVFGESMVVGRDAKVERDLTVAGARLKLEGVVSRDVLGGAETAVISGQIGRNFDAELNALTIDSSAIIGGSLAYAAPKQAEIATGAMIVGETHYTERTQQQNNAGAATRFWGALFGLASMLIIGLAALVGAPRALDAVAVTVRRRPLASFAGGAAVLLITPIISVLLMVSIFGILLGVAMLLTWIAALICSMTFGAYAVGWFVVEKLNWPSRGRRLASLLLGLMIMLLVGLVPLVGGLALFFLMVFGLGAMAVVAGSKLHPKKVAAKEA